MSGFLIRSHTNQHAQLQKQARVLKFHISVIMLGRKTKALSSLGGGIAVLHLCCFLAHLSRRLIGELIGYSWSDVRPSVLHTSTISNFNISATSCPIVTKFYLKHHCVGGKDALGFGPDGIRTLVSMATDSSHRVIMGKML